VAHLVLGVLIAVAAFAVLALLIALVLGWQ